MYPLTRRILNPAHQTKIEQSENRANKPLFKQKAALQGSHTVFNFRLLTSQSVRNPSCHSNLIWAKNQTKIELQSYNYEIESDTDLMKIATLGNQKQNSFKDWFEVGNK